jgi:hypothetical protein
MRRVLIGSEAMAVLCLAGTAVAAGKHSAISIKPSHRTTTDRAVTVSYRVSSRLPSGFFRLATWRIDIPRCCWRSDRHSAQQAHRFRLPRRAGV